MIKSKEREEMISPILKKSILVKIEGAIPRTRKIREEIEEDRMKKRENLEAKAIKS